MHPSLSGADHLKEERLRFVAAIAHHASEDSCDVSSEGDTESVECDSPSKVTVDVAHPTSVTMSAAGSCQQAMSCYNQLPEPATIVGAVRDLLQQHGEPREMQQQLQSMLFLAQGSPEAAAATEYMQQIMDSLSVTDAQDNQDTAPLLHDTEVSVHFQQQPPPKPLPPHTALGSPEEDASSVVVHKFPVEKQLLLQMRFRQLYSRAPARLVTTPAESLPVRSLAAGMVSPSHVGPAVSSYNKPEEAGQTSAEHLRSLLLDNADVAHVGASQRLISLSRWPDKPLSLPCPEVPRFEDLRNQQDTASQQAGGIGNLVQHDIADPGVYSQWPDSPPRRIMSQEPYPIPIHQLPQQLHGQQQLLPSYAWSTEQLTAIATAAATAAAAAVQTQPGQPAVTVHTPQQAPAITAALSEPVVRQGLQVPLALQALPSTKPADGAQTLADQGAVAKQEQVLGQDAAAVSVAQQPKVTQSVQVNKSQHGRGQPGVPKQADALQKLKHRKAVGRSSTGHSLQGKPVCLERQTAATSGGNYLEQPAVPMGSDFQPVSQQLPHQQMASIACAQAGLRNSLVRLPVPQVLPPADDLHQQAIRMVQGRLGGPGDYAGLRLKLQALQAACVLECSQLDRAPAGLHGKPLPSSRQGSADNVVEELHNCMAADDTFSSVQALQDAVAKDVEQRIATAHMRPLPSKPAAARGASNLNNAPGTKRKFAAPFTELSLNTQPLLPKAQQAGNPPGPNSQQHTPPQPPPANTRRKKKPRVAFGRRVGSTLPRQTLDDDPSGGSQEGQQLPLAEGAAPSAMGSQALQSTADGRKPSAHRLQPLVDASRALPTPQHAVPAAKHAAPPADRHQAHGYDSQAVAAQRPGQPQAIVHTCKQQKASVMARIENMTATAARETDASLVKALLGSSDHHSDKPARRATAARVPEATWQAPYNHQAYADELLQSGADAPPAACETSPVNAADAAPAIPFSHPGFQPASCPHAQSMQARDNVCVAAAAAADTELQQQYDDLLLDLAAQHQQQAQLPSVRHSRVWDMQLQPGTGTPVQNLRLPCNKVSGTPKDPVQAMLAPVRSASPIQASVTGRMAAQAATSLPEDPFQQQLPQHLLHPAQACDHQQLPQQLMQDSAESRPLSTCRSTRASTPAVALQQTAQLQSAQMSHATLPASCQASDAQVSDAQSAGEMQWPTPRSSNVSPAAVKTTVVISTPSSGHGNPTHDLAGAHDQLRATASSSTGSKALPKGSSSQQLADTRHDDGQQSAGTGLLRASLAEWLANAVANRLWSAFHTGQPTSAEAAPEADAQDNKPPKLPRDMPGALVQRGAIEQLARQAVSEELAVLLATTDVQAGDAKQQWQTSVRASVISQTVKHSSNSSSRYHSSQPPQSVMHSTGLDMADSPQAVTKQSPAQAGERLHATAQPELYPVTAHMDAPVVSASQRAADAMQNAVGLQAAVAAPLSAVASPQAAVGVLHTDGSGVSPLDDALLQLVLQTLSESSLEQLQQHQQRQQQEQQVHQQDAIRQQLALQLLAQSSLQQIQKQDEDEQQQQQDNQQPSDAHEAMLQSLAEAALAGLSQEQQQQQEQQKLLEQQQAVYEQQQQLLQQQSAVHDALLQQQQWEQAHQQQQLFTEQQRLIKHQQAMLQTLQAEQQESSLMSHQAVLQTQMQLQGELDSCAGSRAVAQAMKSDVQQQSATVTSPGVIPDPPSPEAQQTPSQAASAPPFPTGVREAEAEKAVRHSAAAAQAADSVSNPTVSATSAAEMALDMDQASMQAPIQALTQARTQAMLKEHVAVLAQYTSLPPPSSPCSESTAPPQQQAQALPANSAAVLAAASLLPGSAGMPAFTPQAYYLIPASAYDHGALPMLLPATAVPQHAPHLTFVPMQQESPAVLEAQLPAETPNQHMHEHPQQTGMQVGDPLEPQADRELMLAALEQQGSECETKLQPTVGCGLEGGLHDDLHQTRLPGHSPAVQGSAWRPSPARQGLLCRAQSPAAPLPPVSHPWMERLLKELSVDEDEPLDQTLGPYGCALSFTPTASEGLLYPNGSPTLGQAQASTHSKSGKEDNSHHQVAAIPSRQLIVGQVPAAKQARLAAQPLSIAPGALGQATAGDAITVGQHPGEASAQQADNGLSRLQATLQLLDQVNVDTAGYLQATPQQPANSKEDPARSQAPGDDDSDQLPLEPGLQSMDAKTETDDITEQSFRAERQHTGDDEQHHDGKRQPVDDSGQGPMGSRQHPIGTGLPSTSSRQHGSDIGQQPAHTDTCFEDNEQHADAVGQHALLTRHVSEPGEAHLPAVANLVAHCSDQRGLEETLSESDSQHLGAVTQADDAASPPTAAEHAVRQEQESYNEAVESSAGADHGGTALSEQQLVRDYQEGHFQRYLWREDQRHPFQQGAPAAKSPSEASNSLSGEDEDEALPTSLSGMARHYQAQKSARGTRRCHSVATTDARRAQETEPFDQHAHPHQPGQQDDNSSCSSDDSLSSSCTEDDRDNCSTDDAAAVTLSAVTGKFDRVTWQRQSSSTASTYTYAYRYASRAKQYAIQRRNIVQQAGIQDSLLCSTATGTAATTSTRVSSLDMTAESSFSTLQTASSLFASPASVLPVVHEDSTGADARSIGGQQPVHQHRYDMLRTEDYDVSDATALRQPRSAVSTGPLEALKQKLGAASKASQRRDLPQRRCGKGFTLFQVATRGFKSL
ncbi:hypothetical protein WJX77_006948 [Trebouxia sp. C0004]